MKHTWLALALIISTAYGAQIDAVNFHPIAGIPDVYQVITNNGVIYISSQPTEAEFFQLAHYHIKTVVNLRPLDSTSFNEESDATELSINYILLPIDLKLANFRTDTIRAFNTTLQSSNNYPMLVHSLTTEQAAMMLAFNDITVYHAPVSEAVAEAQVLGDNDPLNLQFIAAETSRYNLTHYR